MTASSFVFAFENGRLGNQLFQYIAAKKYVKNCHIVLLGMNSLSSFMSDSCLTFVPLTSFQIRLLNKVWPVFIRFVAKFKLFSLVLEKRDGKSLRHEYVAGFFSRVYLLHGFFQYSDNFDDSISIFSADKLVKLSRKRLQVLDNIKLRLKIDYRPSNWFFCHVRRGDYTHWPSSECPAVVPEEWLFQCLDRLFVHNPEAIVFALSDDVEYISSLFVNSYPGRLFILSSDLFSDFASMTLCQGGGILSASTFSLWASFFAKMFSNENKPYFVAPYYWAGFRSNDWFPSPELRADWINYDQVFCHE